MRKCIFVLRLDVYKCNQCRLTPPLNGWNPVCGLSGVLLGICHLANWVVDCYFFVCQSRLFFFIFLSLSFCLCLYLYLCLFICSATRWSLWTSRLMLKYLSQMSLSLSLPLVLLWFLPSYSFLRFKLPPRQLDCHHSSIVINIWQICTCICICLCPCFYLCICPFKGRVRVPKRLNFRKNSKRPLARPHFRKIMLDIFFNWHKSFTNWWHHIWLHISSIQLLKKHTLNPELTLLHQYHAQKALFKCQNLWHKFLDWKCPPPSPPLKVLRKFIRSGTFTRPFYLSLSLCLAFFFACTTYATRPSGWSPGQIFVREVLFHKKSSCLASSNMKEFRVRTCLHIFKLNLKEINCFKLVTCDILVWNYVMRPGRVPDLTLAFKQGDEVVGEWGAESASCSHSENNDHWSRNSLWCNIYAVLLV